MPLYLLDNLYQASLKKRLTRTIWQEVFGDEEFFIKLYLEAVFRSEETLLFIDYQRERAFAHIGFPSFSFAWRSQNLQLSYISGAATSSFYRKKGWMRKLLKTAHYRMYLHQKDLAFLVPATRELYQFYTSVADYYPASKARTISFQSKQADASYSTEQYLEDLVKRKSFLSSYIYPTHTYRHWMTAIQSAILGKGKAIVSDTFFLLVADPSLTIREKFLSFLPPAGLLPSLPDREISKPYLHGMIRIINAEKVLKKWSILYPLKRLTFILIDKDLFVNSGFYKVENGRVLKRQLNRKELSRYAMKMSCETNLSIPIFTPYSLADLIFPNYPFYFDLLLDPVVEK